MLRFFRVIYLKLIFFIYGGDVYSKKIGVNIGRNCRILTDKFGSEPYLVTLGDNVTLTGGVRIITHDGAASLIINENGERYFRYAPVNIGSDVFIGVDAIIMPGVTIGNNVIVAAGSIVTKDVKSHTVVGGIPASYICSFYEYELKIRNVGCTNSQFDIRSKKDIKRMAFDAIRSNNEH